MFLVGGEGGGERVNYIISSKKKHVYNDDNMESGTSSDCCSLHRQLINYNTQ